MRKASLATAALGAVLALLYLWEARRYPWGSVAQPGPGLYPALVGALVLLASLGVGIETASRRSGRHVDWPVGPALRRLAAILGPTAGYVALLPYLGHPVAGTLLTLAVLHAMGLGRWPVKIGVAVAVGLGSHYVFAALLGVPLPVGAWRR